MKQYKTKSDTKKQFSAILYELAQSKIQSVEKLKDYIEVLVKNTDRGDGKKNHKCIPIMKIQERAENLDYGRYYKIINTIMNNILRKLTFIGKRELDYFCPIESVILFYMIECIENGKKQNITIDNQQQDCCSYEHKTCLLISWKNQYQGKNNKNKAENDSLTHLFHSLNGEKLISETILLV